jgi:hypothetical protein
LPSVLDRPAWQPGSSGRAYIVRRESPGGAGFHLVTWLPQASWGSAEAMKADGINLRDPQIDWALLRISPNGSFVLWDPRDMTASGSRRLNAMSAAVTALDSRLTPSTTR